MALLQESDLVLLVGQDRKQFIVRLKPGTVLQTHRGCVLHDDLIGQPPGREVRSHLGYPFALLQPSLTDLIAKLRRTTQIMYPKDIAHVLMRLDVKPGDRVIEAGTGSGAMALAMGRAVGSTGRLFSYEAREDILQLARANLEGLGLAALVELKQRDIGLGFDETDVDSLFLDLRCPWEYLSHVVASLKDGGLFGAIVPTTNQVTRLLRGLEMQDSFAQIEVEEVLVRAYKVVPERLRPLDRMIAHTGYLVFARKVSQALSQAVYWEDRRRRKYEEVHLDPEDEDAGRGDLG